MWTEKVEKIMMLMQSSAEDRQMALSLLDGLVEIARNVRETTGEDVLSPLFDGFSPESGVIGRVKDVSGSVPSYFTDIAGWHFSRWRPANWGGEDVIVPLTDLYFRYYPSKQPDLSKYVTVQNLFSSASFLRGCKALDVYYPFDMNAVQKVVDDSGVKRLHLHFDEKPTEEDLQVLSQLVENKLEHLFVFGSDSRFKGIETHTWGSLVSTNGKGKSSLAKSNILYRNNKCTDDRFESFGELVRRYEFDGSISTVVDGFGFDDGESDLKRGNVIQDDLENFFQGTTQWNYIEQYQNERWGSSLKIVFHLDEKDTSLTIRERLTGIEFISGDWCYEFLELNLEFPRLRYINCTDSGTFDAPLLTRCPRLEMFIGGSFDDNIWDLKHSIRIIRTEYATLGFEGEGALKDRLKEAKFEREILDNRPSVLESVERLCVNGCYEMGTLLPYMQSVKEFELEQFVPFEFTLVDDVIPEGALHDETRVDSREQTIYQLKFMPSVRSIDDLELLYLRHRAYQKDALQGRAKINQNVVREFNALQANGQSLPWLEKLLEEGVYVLILGTYTCIHDGHRWWLHRYNDSNGTGAEYALYIQEQKSSVDDYMYSPELNLKRLIATGPYNKSQLVDYPIYRYNSNHVPISDLKSLPSLRKLAVRVKLTSEQLDAIWELEQLEELVLNGQDLGRLPGGIGQLRNLKRLFVTSNALQTLPEELSNCINLEMVSVFNNPIKTCPDSIKQLPKLCRVIGEHVKTWIPELTAQGTWGAHSVPNSISAVDLTTVQQPMDISPSKPPLVPENVPIVSSRTTKIERVFYQYDLLNIALKDVQLSLFDVRISLQQTGYTPGNLTSSRLSLESIETLIAMIEQHQFGDIEHETMKWIVEHIGLHEKATKRWKAWCKSH
jgi:hypothetical protein